MKCVYRMVYLLNPCTRRSEKIVTSLSIFISWIYRGAGRLDPVFTGTNPLGINKCFDPQSFLLHSCFEREIERWRETQRERERERGREGEMENGKRDRFDFRFVY